MRRHDVSAWLRPSWLISACSTGRCTGLRPHPSGSLTARSHNLEGTRGKLQRSRLGDAWRLALRCAHRGLVHLGTFALIVSSVVLWVLTGVTLVGGLVGGYASRIMDQAYDAALI